MLENLKNTFKRSSSAYQKESIKNLNYIYQATYGFWFEKDIDRKLKYAWFAINTIPHLIQCASPISYCLTQPKVTMEEHAQMGVPVIETMLVVTIYISTHLHSSRILQLFNVMDEAHDTDFEQLTINEEKDKKEMTSVLLRRIASFFLFIPITWILSLIANLLRVNEYGVQSLYFFSFAGVNEVTSRGAYILIYMMQVLTIVVAVTFVFGTLFFADILTMETHNEASALVKGLRASSKTFKGRLESFHRTDLVDEGLRTEILCEQGREKKLKICNNFQYDLILCIRNFQQVVRKVNASKPVLEHILSCIVINLFLTVIFFGFTMTKFRMVSLSEDISAAIGFSGLGFTVFYLHYVTDKYDKLNGLIANEVYALPWYELPPLHRKNILLLLTLTQKNRRLYSVKVFPATLEFVPTIANNIYSYIINMRNINTFYY